MTADLTRRNFLRGMVAAAGVAAVGLPAIEAIASVAPPPQLPFPDHEDGDLFIKVKGVWRFVCKVQKFEIMQHHLQHDIWIHRDGMRTCYPTFRDPGQFSMTSYFDKEGYGLLAGAYYEGMTHELALSQHGMLITMQAFFAAMAISTASFDEDLIRMEIEARLSAPMEMIAA